MTVSEPEPPPYDSIDELPAYSNSIHLVSLCRRKLEYRAPNVPARKGTRGWNFYWLVLCGTALNVFQPNQRELKAHLKREAAIRAARLKEHNNRQRRKTNDSPSQYSIAPRPRNVLHPHPHPHPIESFTRTTTPHSSSPPPPSSPSSSPSPSPSAVHKLPFDVACESLDQPLISSEPPPLVIGGKLHPGNAAGPDVRTHKLVKQYAMNGATCVRAYDYLRRYFVLRIRADGQQFMVQLNSYPETLEWLAAFSVAACLSLDLDERPMVEPLPYSRRPRHPSDSPTPTGDGQIENSNPQRAETFDSSQASEPFLAHSAMTTIRINV